MLSRLTVLVFLGLLLVAVDGSPWGILGQELKRPSQRARAYTKRVVQLERGGSFAHTAPTAASGWYGVRHVPLNDMQTVADNLGGAIIELGVTEETPGQINAMLDQAATLGFRVLLNMYTAETHTNRPWYWNGQEWVFPQSTVETLQGIAHHPALFAIYALHEPLDGGETYVPIEQQRQLYQLLKRHTEGLPVFSDLGALGFWEDLGIEFTDGICDYCCTFPSHFRSDWTSQRCMAEILRRIEEDLDTQQRLMPGAEIVFLINTYSHPDFSHPIRLPTPEELAALRDYLCALNLPMMYYPWSHSLYEATLKDAPQLWLPIAEGCTRTTYLPLIVREALYETSPTGSGVKLSSR